MSFFSSLPSPIKRSLVGLGHWSDRRLLRRRGGRIARFFNEAGDTFISCEIGDAAGLIRALRARGIRFVILGGTVGTTLARSGRLTLLIADEDVDSMRRLLTFWPVGEPCAAYCPSGLYGFSFGGMALFPPPLARRLLDGARDVAGDSLPEPRDFFFCTVYRDLYLRGLDAGIPSTLAGPAEVFDPSRGLELEIEAARLGIQLETPLTMESLDALLFDNGWRPPLDVLERVRSWNRWVAMKLDSEGHSLGSEPPGLTVFYLRRLAVDSGATKLVMDTLRAGGFRLFELPALSDDEMAAIAAEVRGGNWGRGPWPVSGGEPASIFLGFDPAPIVPDARALDQFPLLDNLRINIAKESVRAAVQAGLPKRLRYNPLHSTDNAVQAWRVVRSLYPDYYCRLREEISRA